MTRRLALFSFLSLLPLPSRAHLVPIQPVDIQVKIEADQVRVRIVCAHEYWLSELLDVRASFSAVNWPEPMQEKSKEIISKSFQLFLDGKPLPIKTLQCRYVEEPLKLTKPYLQFDVVYPLPLNGAMVSGRSAFFQEEYVHYLRGGKPEFQKFWTHLTISGQKDISLTLPIEKPDFEFPVSEFRRTPFQYAAEAFVFSIRHFLSDPFLALFCLAGVAIYKGAGAAYGRGRAFMLAVILLFMMVSFFFFPEMKSTRNTTIQSWVWFSLFLVLPVLGRATEKTTLITLVIVAIGCWRGVLLRGSLPLPFSLEVSPLAKSGFLAGTLVMMAGTVLAAELAVRSAERALSKKYESLAPRFLTSHLRALCGLLLFVSFMEIVRLGLGRS